MASAPQTLCFLFTDIEGSTRLWELFPAAMSDSLALHDGLLRAAIEGSDGTVVKTTGDGVMAVFPTASHGLAACLLAQFGLTGASWGATGPLLVRMGLHVGEANAMYDDYRGPAVNRAARIMAAGHGGQVLLSSVTAALVADDLPAGSSLIDLGEHRLKDLGRAERVSQLVHPDLRRDFPPLVTVDARAYRLPAERSGFVGRESAVTDVVARLRSVGVRLLTLTGPGGIGKTRLALRAAHVVAPAFPNAAAFVDLSEIRDSEAVLTGIARAIGLPDASQTSQLEALSERLRDERVLLVLDNFEQVTAAGPTVMHLVQDCPGVKLLVTSREALNVRGEHLYPVPPMSLPLPASRATTAAELGQYEAVRLFVERAQSMRPGFELTDGNASMVAEICQRLDGLPLAIELATARIGLLSLEALRDRLGSRLAFLHGGARDLPERQQTLRATIEWSYELLPAGEQRIFEVLASFEGASVEAVENVTSRLNGRLKGVDALDALASLVSKSLLRRGEAGGREPRFEMLETIREYASERLAELPDLAAASRRAHAIWYADLAKREVKRLDGPERDEVLAGLLGEVENLRAAWRYWVAESDLDRLDMLVDALWPLFDAKGWYRATIDLANDVLTVLDTMTPTPERLEMALTMRTSVARALLAMEGYTQAVEEAYGRAMALFEGADTPRLLPVLRGLASFHIYRAEFEKGAEVGRHILRLAELDGGERFRVDGHLVLGSCLGFLGDLEGGLAELDSGIEWFESHSYRAGRFHLGNDPRVATLATSGFQLWLVGRPDSALLRSRRSLALADSIDHPSTKAYANFHAGFLRLWRQEFEFVRDHAERVIETAAEHDLHIWTAIGTCLRGAAQVSLVGAAEGLDGVEEGIRRYAGQKTPPVFWPLLMYVRAGAYLRAARAADGLAFIDEAIRVAGPRGSIRPELLMMKGDMLLAAKDHGSVAGTPDAMAARTLYEQAVEDAALWGARLPGLRAALRLCRLESALGSEAASPALDALGAIVGTFTEGLDSTDVLMAREMLAGGAGR